MKKLVIANWKMNKTNCDTRHFLDDFKSQNIGGGADIVICAPFTSLWAIQESGIAAGAQNFHHAKSGAFTGEISLEMLKELNVATVLAGHSERRTLFGETDALVNQKVCAALFAGMTAVLCIGETQEDRNANQTESVLEKQLTEGLSGVTATQAENLAIAYEPVWAIGTGVVASAEQIAQTHKFIKTVIAKLFPKAKLRVLYGGSVNEKNASEIMSIKNVDGVLVGGASLDAAKFAAIISAAQ